MPETPYSPPPIERRSVTPPGVLPRNAQRLVIGGIALLMVIIIAFSGGKAPKERRSQASSDRTVVEPNDVRIREIRERIEQQAQKLAPEQARLAQFKQPTATGMDTGSGNIPSTQSGGRSLSEPSVANAYPIQAPRERNWIDLDWEKRQHQSRFVSNVVLTHRGRTTSVPAGADAIQTERTTASSSAWAASTRARSRRSPTSSTLAA